MDIKMIQVVRKVRTEVGVVLPYRREHHGPWDFSTTPASLPVERVEEGTVFVSWATVQELADQQPFDSEFGGALLLDLYEGLALEQAGFAVQETRGGYHGTKKTKKLNKHLSATYESADDPVTLLRDAVKGQNMATLRREWPILGRAIDKILIPGK